MATITRMAARPAKHKDKRMDTTLPVRLTSDQRDLIEQAAESVSLEASTWVRMVSVEAAKKRLAEISEK